MKVSSWTVSMSKFTDYTNNPELREENLEVIFTPKWFRLWLKLNLPWDEKL